MIGDNNFEKMASKWREWTAEHLAQHLKTFSLSELQSLRAGIKPADRDVDAYKSKAKQINRLLLCAELAALKPPNEADLQNALEKAKNLLGLQTDIQIESLILGRNFSWKELLFTLMEKATWDETFPLPAAMDLVAYCLDEPIETLARVEFCALVADISRTPTGAEQIEGTPAKLIVELVRVPGWDDEPIPNGDVQPRVYADPFTMGMTQLETDFLGSIKAAVEWAKEKALLTLIQSNHAVRWSVTRYSAVGGTKSFHWLKGASAGLAFALAIGKLGALQVPADHGSRTDLMKKLSELILEGASASAQIKKEGNTWKLSPISAEYEKVVAAFTTTKVLPRIRFVLMADQQQGLTALPESETTKILKCKTIAVAVERLDNHLNPVYVSIMLPANSALNQRTILETYDLYIGRGWLDELIDNAVSQAKENKKNFVLLKAFAGFGKTAMMVNRYKQNGRNCPYFFLRPGSTDPNEMVRSLTAQIRWLYDIPEPDLQDDQKTAQRVFALVLEAAAKKLDAQAFLEILIDGVDESFGRLSEYGDFRLTEKWLPAEPDKRVVFILTSRPDGPDSTDPNLAKNCVVVKYPPSANNAELQNKNNAGILEFIKFKNATEKLNLSETLMANLAKNSQGNFLVAVKLLEQNAKFQAWEQNPGDIPNGLDELLNLFLKEIIDKLNNQGLSVETAKRILGTMALAEAPLNLDQLVSLIADE